MTDHDDTNPEARAHDAAPGFFDRPSTRRFIWIALIGACAASALAGFVVEMHAYFEIANFPLFYAIFGFAAFAFIVLAGQHLRKILMRPEDYYDR